jgi:hypothetical protein
LRVAGPLGVADGTGDWHGTGDELPARSAAEPLATGFAEPLVVGAGDPLFAATGPQGEDDGLADPEADGVRLDDGAG